VLYRDGPVPKRAVDYKSGMVKELRHRALFRFRNKVRPSDFLGQGMRLKCRLGGKPASRVACWEVRIFSRHVQEKILAVSSPRIQFISYRGKQILMVNLANLSAAEVEKTVRAVPEIVAARPRDSVLILSDFTGASFDQEAVRAMKESAVFDKPYVKKSAWIGVESFPEVFRQNLKSFSQREFPTFKSRQEALEWLATD